MKMIKYKRPSGTFIEIYDTANNADFAEKNGWLGPKDLKAAKDVNLTKNADNEK